MNSNQDKNRHEILSEEEIAAMLESIISDSANNCELESCRKRVRLYDFRRPDRFTKDNMQAILMVMEMLAHNMTCSISSRLKVSAGIHVASTDQLTYGEFIRSVPVQTSFVEIGFTGLPGTAVLELDPHAALTISDLRMGVPAVECGKRTSFTKIDESALAAEFSGHIGFLDSALSALPHGRSFLKRFTNDTGSISVCAPDCLSILVTFMFRIGGVEEMMNLCLPYPAIEPLIGLLSTDHLLSSMEKRTGRRCFADFDVDAHVAVKGGNLTFRELRGLKAGDVLPVAGIDDGVMRLDLVLGGAAASRALVNDNATSADFRIPKTGTPDILAKKRTLGSKSGLFRTHSHCLQVFRKKLKAFRIRRAPEKLSRLLCSLDDQSRAELLSSQPQPVRNFLFSHLNMPQRKKAEASGIAAAVVSELPKLADLNETAYEICRTLFPGKGNRLAQNIRGAMFSL